MSLYRTCLQFRSNAIIQYQYRKRDRLFTRARQNEFTENLKKIQTYTGALSFGAKKRLRKCVGQLIESSPELTVYNTFTGQMMPFRLAFITLTIAETDRMITSKEAYKTCLSKFLRWMREVKKAPSYIWKCELQERGQVHYHITTNKFIDAREIQSKWNALQKDAGYLNHFWLDFGHYNPPSTSVEGVREYSKIVCYMVKKVADNYEGNERVMSEMVKDMQNVKSVGGKVWDCSTNLKRYGNFTTDLDPDYEGKLFILANKREIEKTVTDHCTIYNFKNFPPAAILHGEDKGTYEDLMTAIYKEDVRTENDTGQLKLNQLDFKRVNWIDKVIFSPRSALRYVN